MFSYLPLFLDDNKESKKSNSKKTKRKGWAKKDGDEDPQTKSKKDKRKDIKYKKAKRIEEESSSDDDSEPEVPLRKTKSPKDAPAKPLQRNLFGKTNKTTKALAPSNQKSTREKGRRSPAKRSKRSLSNDSAFEDSGERQASSSVSNLSNKKRKKVPPRGASSSDESDFPADYGKSASKTYDAEASLSKTPTRYLW